VVWAQQDTGPDGVFLAQKPIDGFVPRKLGIERLMGKSKEPLDRPPTEEIIAAFDRERAASQELNRQHTEKVRAAHAGERQSLIERRRRPR
jgi:hypothetical protein